MHNAGCGRSDRRRPCRLGQPLLGIGMGLDAPYIKDVANHTPTDIRPIFIFQTISYLLHSEKDAAECR